MDGVYPKMKLKFLPRPFCSWPHKALLPCRPTGRASQTLDVTFGSGNASGSFSGDNSNGVEAGLRAKLRYDS
jgi:hypothetical protein